ncbi:hypothetical protein B0H13DRAFT_2510908 [Mycena leptocephala]|nr:hypothetical protein B0H13DRAFT_2510908 [Mycena leptocephala]
MAHQHQYIPCTHGWLEYQVCDCGYFAWTDPELFNAAERRHANSPANGAPPFPPPDYPDDPWSASPHLPSVASNIDPSDESIQKYSPQHTTTRRSFPASKLPPHPLPKRPTLPLLSTISVSPPPSTPVDADTLWAESRVWVPDGCGVWPETMYARDMATAFRLITAAGEDSVSERFKTVFGLDGFPKPTWYKQYQAWKRSTQEERDMAMRLPRTFDGLWKEWRKSSMGWAAVSGKGTGK